MFNTSQLQEWQKQQRSPTTSRQSSSTTSTSSLFPQATNTQPQHNKNKTQSVLFPTNTPHNVGKSTSQQPSLYSNMPPVTSSTSASLFPSNPPVHTSNNTQNTRPNNNGGIPTPTGASLFGPASTSNSSMNANVSSSTKTNQAPPPLFGSYTPSHATANTRVSNSGINNNINPHTHTNTGTHSLFGVAPSTRTAAGGQHLRTDSTDSRASSYGTRLSQSQAYVHTQPLHTQRQASVTGNSHSSFQRDTQPSSTTPSGSTRNSLVGGADGIMSLNTGTVNQDVDTDSNIDTRTSISSEGLAKFPTIPTGPLERNDSTDSLDGLFRTPVPADIKPSTTATLPTRSDTVVAPTQQQQQQQQHRTQQVYQPALQHTQVEPQAFPPTHPPTQPPVEYSTQPQTSSDNLQQTMPGYLPTTLINSESVFPAAPPVWKSSGLPVSTFTPSQPQSNSGQSTAEGQHTDETPSRMQSSTADGLEDAQAFNRTGSSASTAVQRSGSIPTPRLGAPPMFNPTPVFGAPPVFSAPPQPAHDVAASFQSGAAKVQSEPATTQTVQPSVPTTGVVFRGSFDFSQLQGDGVSDSQIQTNINSQGVDGERYMSTGSMDNAPDTATSIPPPPPMFGAPPTQAPIQTPRESTPAEAEGVYTPPEADRPSQQQPEEWLHRTSVGESEACAAAHGQTHGLANTAKQAPTNEPPATIPGTNTPAPGVPVFRGSFDFDAIHPDDPVDSAQPPPIQNDPTPATMTHASPTSMASHTRPPTQAEPPWNQSEQSLANTDAQSPQENATVAERQPQSGVPVFRGSFDFNNMQPESGENAPESTQGGATHSDSGYMTQATETHRTHSGAQADGQAPAQPGMQGFPQQQTRATMGPPPMFLPVQAGIPSMPSAAPPVPLQTPRQEVTPQQQQGMPMPGHPDTAQVPDFSAPHSEQPVSGQNEVSPPLPQQAEQTPAYLKQQVPRPGIPVFRGSFDFSAMQRDDAQGSDPVQIQGESGPISESEYTAAHGTTLGGQQQALPVVHMAQVDQQQQQQQHQQDQQQPPQQGLSESQAQAQMGSTSLPGVAAFRGSLDLNAMREDMDSTPTTDTHPEHTSQTHPQPAQHPPASTIGQPVFRGSFDFTQMQNDTDAPGESSQAAAPTPEPSQERSQFYNPNAYTAPQQPSAFDAMAAPGNTINNYQSDVPYDQGVGISTVPTGRGSLNFNKMQSNEDPQAAFSPPATHWFYKHYETKGWTAFSILDNDALEKAHHESVAASAITGDVVVPVNGGRYDAFLSKRKMQAVYWMEDAMEIARCSWMKKHMNGAMKPYPEEVGELLEREYTQAYRTDTWNRRIVTPAGDLVVMFSPTVAVHYNKSEAAAIEIYGHQDNSGESPKEPFMAVRGFDSIVFDAGEGPPDHLYLVVHGIGNKVDLKQRDLVQATRSMRTSSRRLRKNALDEGGDPVPVAEYLPIMWHSSLHSNTGVDAKINAISLQSIRMLREFVNTTVLDVLYFTSPHYCQTIADTVAKELNRVYQLFTLRHPNFDGKVNIVGHSLGSIIAFDILAHQQVPGATPMVETTPVAPAVPATAETTVKDESTAPQTERELQVAKAREKYRRMRERRGMPPSPALTPMPSLSALSPNGVNPVISAIPAPEKAVTDSSAIGIGQPQVSYRKLDFQPAALFALGSPIGMFLTVRGVEPLGPDFKLPTCDEFYNIFHPYDPVAFRIEPLLDANMANVQPCEIQSHTGRKKLHVELKNLGTSIFSTVKSSWSSWGSWGGAGQSQDPAPEKSQPSGSNPSRKKLDNKVMKNEPDPYYEGWTGSKAPAINKGQRVDYALQCGLLESMNEYMFAITSHLVYWENLDTAALLLKDAKEARQR